MGLCYASYTGKKPKRPLPTLESYINFPQHNSSPDVQVFYGQLYQITEITAVAFAVYIHSFSECEI